MPLDIIKVAEGFLGKNFRGSTDIKVSGVQITAAGQKVKISSQGLNATLTEQDGTVKESKIGGGEITTGDFTCLNLTCQLKSLSKS